MNSGDPDQIRRQIEGTRRDLSADVNALTEKVSPSRVVSRRVERARDTMTNVKDKIMGTADTATTSASDAAANMTDRMSEAASGAVSGTAEAVSAAPRAVRSRTEGTPLAAGLVAFGLGWLISSLLPSTRKERELASQATQVMSEQLQPVAQQARQAATEVAANMREPARQAVESVKSTASDAASTVTDEGRTAADQVAGRAGQARENVQDQAQR